MFEGYATPQGTQDFLNRHATHSTQKRTFCGMTLPSLAMGTYLGPMNFPTDHRVTQTATQALSLGMGFFDTAINYRGQRAETAIGEALRQNFLKNTLKRKEVFISSKAGFIPFEKEPVEDLKKLFKDQYVTPGIVEEKELIAECYCLHPKYIENQLNRSRKNLGLNTIDLYYIHNPETVLDELPSRILFDYLERTFTFLESAREKNHIRSYGIATWDGLRTPTDGQAHLNLEKIYKIAEKVGGKNHGLKAIQLPLNLAMLEAGWFQSQDSSMGSMSVLKLAHELNLSVAVSAPLYQGRLAEGLPPFITKHFPKKLSDAQMSLLFASSVPGVASTMVGLKDPKHLDEAAAVLRMERLSVDQINGIAKSIMTKS